MKYSQLLGISMLAVGMALSCGQGQSGVQGPKGDPGTPGTPAMIPVSATPPTACTNTSIGMFYVDTSAGMPRLSFCDGTKWAPFAGDPDCPAGYARDQSATGIVLCKKGVDEVVKVGSGGSAFWIDRFEASVWDNADGSGMQYGGGATRNFPVSFPADGQWTRPLYALSKVGVYATSGITWFQAAEACRASGKRLPTGEEWQTAARGTLDPPTPSDGTSGDCVTETPVATGRDISGSRTGCFSAWGAQDMIGSVSEFTADMLAGVGDLTGAPQLWPAGFNGDYTQNVVGTTSSQSNVHISGIPAVVIRGGSSVDGTGAGLFFFSLSRGPIHDWYDLGFRCVLLR